MDSLTKVYVFNLLLRTLEANDGLCLDNEKERVILNKILINLLENSNLEIQIKDKDYKEEINFTTVSSEKHRLNSMKRFDHD